MLTTPTFTAAQQPRKLPTLAILEPGSAAVRTNGFLRGLRELGYVDGQNIVVETHFGKSKPERLREVAAGLVRSAPDVIWTHSNPAVLLAKQATTTIPIVAGVASELVETGIVSSLARPGGNITGMELRDTEVIGKRLEILAETVLKAQRVAVIVDSNDPSHAIIPKNIEREARALKVQLQRVEVSGPEAFDKAFSAMVQGHADAGSLLSYGANVGDMCRRSAALVDKILKGRKPADLPVGRAHRFELVVNLKTAKQIGVTIPPHVLVRADRVIK